ncbi:MAG: hypothetical protein K8T91_17140 [Planctomycetes bacterium]|nr:hypothetical protein [Planctomycetota bacterium]
MIQSHSNPFESPESNSNVQQCLPVGKTILAISQGLEIYSRGILILILYAMVATGVSLCVLLGGGLEYFNPAVRFVVRSLNFLTWLVAYVCLTFGLARIALAPGSWAGKKSFTVAMWFQAAGWFVSLFLLQTFSTVPRWLEIGFNLGAWLAVVTALAQRMQAIDQPRLATTARGLRAMVALLAFVGVIGFFLSDSIIPTNRGGHNPAPPSYLATMLPLLLILFAVCTLILMLLTLLLVRRCKSHLTLESLEGEVAALVVPKSSGLAEELAEVPSVGGNVQVKTGLVAGDARLGLLMYQIALIPLALYFGIQIIASVVPYLVYGDGTKSGRWILGYGAMQTLLGSCGMGGAAFGLWLLRRDPLVARRKEWLTATALLHGIVATLWLVSYLMRLSDYRFAIGPLLVVSFICTALSLGQLAIDLGSRARAVELRALIAAAVVYLVAWAGLLYLGRLGVKAESQEALAPASTIFLFVGMTVYLILVHRFRKVWPSSSTSL